VTAQEAALWFISANSARKRGPTQTSENLAVMKPSIVSRLLMLLAVAQLLSGCGAEEEPEAHYDVPAYGWNTLVSVESSTWQACYLDSISNNYIRQQWIFGVTSLRLSEHDHGAADSDCSGSSTLLWRHNYREATDRDLAVALGWADEAGVETLNGGAPDSQDELGALPAQADIRRVIWNFSSADAGTGTAPVPTLTQLQQVLFLDISADPFRLFVGPFNGTLDVDGFPAYLRDFRALEFVQP
jgi:hypothetical protein